MEQTELGITEWAVLSLFAEGRTHGFAVARALAPDGEIGEIWSVRRPLVYRAIDVLTAAEMLETVGEEPSPTGPPRRLVSATRSGRTAVSRWLDEPVEHVRDARTHLLLKLLFLARAGKDARPLLVAQRERFEPVRDALRKRRSAADDFERTLLTWRVEAATAALRFVNSELKR